MLIEKVLWKIQEQLENIFLNSWISLFIESVFWNLKCFSQNIWMNVAPKVFLTFVKLQLRVKWWFSQTSNTYCLKQNNMGWLLKALSFVLKRLATNQSTSWKVYSTISKRMISYHLKTLISDSLSQISISCVFDLFKTLKRKLHTPQEKALPYCDEPEVIFNIDFLLLYL